MVQTFQKQRRRPSAESCSVIAAIGKKFSSSLSREGDSQVM